MIDFGGITYYIDLAAFDKAITLQGSKSTDKMTTTETKTVTNDMGSVIGTEITETVSDRGKEIDATKFDLIRTLFEVVVDYDDEADTSLGAERALESTSFSFKIAFNTLYNYGIIKEKE